MKNLSAGRHNKNKTLYTLFILLLFSTVFFGVSNNCLGDGHLIINEIQTSGGTGKTNYEFIEVYNPNDNSKDLKGFALSKKTEKGADFIKLVAADDFEGEIPAKGYFLIGHKDYEEIIPDVSYSDASIADNNTLYLFDNNGILLDMVGIGKALNFEGKETAPNPASGKSIERKNFNDTDNNFDDFEKNSTSTPRNSAFKEENEDKEIITNYPGRIIINEIFPAPDTKNGEIKEEFVEILNLTGEKIDFSSWTITDVKNTKAKISKREQNEDFYVFYGTFSLNNDKNGDSVRLYDSKNNLVAEEKYIFSQSEKSYSLGESSWRWTSYLTPGNKNEFDEKLSAKIKKDKKIYKNTYAAFEAQKNSKMAKKFTWDFGDGHKSYLKKTRHKYEKSGNYDASLKVATDKGVKGFEEAIYYFTVKVEKFDAPKIRIKAISPNPKGRDTDNEWIEIENKTKDKINLKNWSIATGTKNLVNHPIRKDFEIKAGKTKKILKKHCAFTLGNAQAKIELRSPDGKAVQKIKYDRTKNKIEEDEIYEKDEEGWNWMKPPSDTEEAQSNTGVASSETSSETSQEGGVNDRENLPDDTENNPTEETSDVDISLSQEEIFSALGKSSLDPRWDKKQKNKIIFLSAGTNIRPPEILLENQARVLGAWTMKKPDPPKEKNWWENWWVEINSGINQILNRI